MSARVLNPMLMTDMRSGLGSSSKNSGRVVPTKAELAPIRRDLFGPVDHAANRLLAETELRAQSRLDAERWGFDFQLGLPRCDARYAWEIVTPNDVVPEPYALRGMPYIRKHAPATPRKSNTSPKFSRTTSTKTTTKTTTTTTTTIIKTTLLKDDDDNVADNDNSTTSIIATTRKAEMTPPQESRVPDIGNDNRTPTGETTPEELHRHVIVDEIILKQNIVEDPTTPVLPPSARKQSAITDFMKSRKRSLKGSSKSIVEPPEKMSRNAGQIRS